jgi:hypothetical protein
MLLQGLDGDSKGVPAVPPSISLSCGLIVLWSGERSVL